MKNKFFKSSFYEKLKFLLIPIGLLIGSLSSPLLADNITSDGDVYLYFNMTSPYNWWNMGTNGSQNFTYFWGTSGSAWSIAAIQVDGDMYAIKVPSGTWGNMILVRNKDTSADWGNWNQSNDQTLSSSHNYLTEFHANDQSDSYKNSQWDDYIPTSTASLSATSTSITTAETSTLTPSLSSNTTYNVIKSTSYSVTTNPGSAGSVTSAGVFSATAAGTYTVTATVTYNAKGFPGIYSSTTATRDITVTSATSWNLYNSSTNLGSFTQVGDYEYSLTVNMSTSYASLQFKKDGSEGYIVGAGDPTSTNQTLSISGGYFSWANIAGVTNGTYVLTIKSDNSGSSWYYRAAKVIQVTYDANGATSGSAPSGSSYSSGDYVSTAAQGGLSKDYYTFDGWNTAADGTGTHYNANTSNAFQISNSVTLYAEWRPNLPANNILQIHGPLFTGGWDKSCITMERTINETNHKQYKHSDVLWDGVSNSEFVFKDNNCTDFLKAKEHIMELVTPTGCTVTSSGYEWYNFRVTTSGPKLITVTVDFYITNHSSVPNAIAIAITAETPATGYYLKHPWNGGSWCWKKLTNESGNNYILREIYGNDGCNYASYDGSTASNGWKDGNSCTKHNTGSFNSGDSCLFVYNSSNNNIDIYKLYPVTFNINGATSGRAPGATSDVTNGTVNFPYGRATTVPSNAGSLAKTGSEFGGWNVNGSGTGTNYTAGSDTYTLSSSSGTLYAKWNAVVVPSITSASLVKSTIGNTETFGVTVNYANIASGSYYRIIAGAGGEYNNASGVLNQSISGTGTSNFVSQSPTIDGTVYVKLYDSSHTLLQTYEVGTLTVVTTHAITVASNNNSYGTVSPTTVYAGSGYASASFTATNESHYHFVNWTKSSENFTLNNANSATTYITTASSGGTVTAIFAGDEYTITYKDINNASYSGSNEGSLPATHTYGTATVLVAGVKAGYSFGGWFTDAACTSSAGSSIGATAYTSDITLYAKWTPKNYTITYDPASAPSGVTYTTTPANANCDATVDMVFTPTGDNTVIVSVVDGSSNPVAVTNPSANTYRFTMPASDVTVTVSASLLPIVYVLKTKHANSSLGDDVTVFPSGGKIWAWRPSDSKNFYKNVEWGTRPSTSVAESITDDVVGDTWYRFIPNNTEYFNASTEYRVILTDNDVEILNTNTTHIEDGSSRSGSSQTGTIWVVPHGTGEHTAYVYTSYPDEVVTPYNVTYDAGDHGSINAFGTTVSSGTTQTIATTKNRTLTATPTSGYGFDRWVTTGGVSVADARSATTTVSATANGGTVTAMWYESVNSNWYIKGDPAGSWEDPTTCPLDRVFPGETNVYYRAVTLESGNRYFRFYTNVNGNKNQYGASLQDNLYVSKNTEYDLTQDGSNNFIYNAGGTIWVVVDASGGTKKCWVQDPQVYYVVTFSPCVGGAVSAVDGSSNPLTSGKGYISGTAITFTQTPSEGYTFKEWNTAADGNGEKLGDDEDGYTIASLSDDVEVYAVYTEDMHTLALNNDGHGKVQIGGVDQTSASVGVATTATITAVPAEGYHFLNWTVDAGVTIVTGSTTANLIEVKTTSDGKSVTANFEADKYVYFDNTYTQWDHVYVYLFTNEGGGPWYTDGDGEGVHPKNGSKVAFSEMSKVAGEENLYEYAYHTSSQNLSFINVAFSEEDQSTYNNFSNMECAYRGDWRASMPIYVAPSYYETKNVNTHYHSNGYWMMKETKYNESVGYSLRHKTGDGTSDEIGQFKATADGSHIATITVRFADTGNRTYFVNNIASQNYCVDHTFTASDDGAPYGLWHYNDVLEFTVTPTSVGNYTFFLEQGPENIQFSIQYPVQTGDRRLVYSYTKDESTKYRYSDVIRKRETTAIASLYIDYNQAGMALCLDTCYGFDGSGNPQWRTISATSGWKSYFEDMDKGVYTMKVNYAGTNGASSTLTEIAPYTGPYYIKTDCAPGGWANYTQNVMYENTINPDATFDYSYCKWIGNTTTNVQCVIANDYNNAISDTLKSDDILVHGTGIQHETLPERGNVRFSFNSTTNVLKRTYLRGSTLSDNFITLLPNASGYVYSAETDGTDYYSSNPKFGDNGNWTYQMDAWIYPTSQAGVKTSYPGWDPVTVQELVPTTNLLMGGTDKGSKRYHVRLVYDFKTDYLMSAWMAGDVDDQKIDLKNDLLYIRCGQNAADQISITSGHVNNINRAFGAIQLRRSDMIALSGNGAAYTEGDRAFCDYYISFPFSVNLQDVFGTGTYGKDWIVQKYNGTKRASIGWFQETKTFWETMSITETMNANEGYILLIERDNYNEVTDENWTNIGESGSVYLYFPSANNIGNIISTTATINVPAHECNIHRSFTIDDKTVWHEITDSHWNMIGVPLFTSQTGNFSSTFIQNPENSKLGYLYEWDPVDNVLKIADASSFTFKSMHGYMVQYYGDIIFTGTAISSSVAARRLPSNEQYKVELQLTNSSETVSRAYVELRENACDTFALNEDVYLMSASKKHNIYTYAGNYPTAANVLSVANHIVPVGMDVKQAGIYKFSMPNNFSGTVTLIDTYTGARTNLALGDYEVSLPVGTISDRFMLEINIHNAPTAIEGIEGGSLKDGKAHKFVQNGVMYILRDGKIYDARGLRVE